MGKASEKATNYHRSRAGFANIEPRLHYNSDPHDP